MSLQHQRISELCADYKLERIASEWLALAQKTLEDAGTYSATFWNSFCNWRRTAVTNVAGRRFCGYQDCQRLKRWSSSTSSSPAARHELSFRSSRGWHLGRIKNKQIGSLSSVFCC
ncbi:Uncharacterised protein [Yersinia frederiksenii]|nr:Uncharacterised protein [Yersinia frederiksenii]